jgi:hypothetical protein
MSLSSILFLFLTHLGVGICFTLLLIGREAGVKFFRFNAGLAAAILASGMLLRPPEASVAADAQGIAVAALFVATSAIAGYWVLIGRALPSMRPVLLWTSVIAGTLALIMQALALDGRVAAGPRLLAIVSFLSSAALLGGSCTAMILGHWYLVLPSLDVAHLQSIVKFHISSTIVRGLVVAAAVFLAIAAWQPGAGPRFDRYILSVAGVFFWQRVLFGLVGPGVLSYLTWQTAKIRSTQSATGILYVDFFTVIVGELLAKYLLLATAVPV